MRGRERKSEGRKGSEERCLYGEEPVNGMPVWEGRVNESGESKAAVLA